MNQFVNILITAFLCVSISGLAQKRYNDSDKKYDGKFLIHLDEDEKIKKTWYHYVVTEKPDGRNIVRIFFPETGQITEKISFKNKKKKVLLGVYETWWDDGTPKDSGQYINDLRHGSWRVQKNMRGEYNQGLKQDVWKRVENGIILEEGSYKDDNKIGTWIKRDSLGQKRSAYNYTAGKLDGYFALYDSTGTVINEGIYDNGKLTEDKVIEESDEKFEIVEVMPHMASCGEIKETKARNMCSQRTMLKYVYSNIKFPADARELGISGNALFQFVVDKEGNITDLKTLKGLCQSIEEECRKTIMGLPQWNPGMQRGKPVKVLFNLPIKFKLE